MDMAHGIHAGVGVGTALVAGYGSPVFRGLAMVEWAPGIASDADGDGISDKEDACPKAKGERSADPVRNGCPAQDTDGEAVPPGRLMRRTTAVVVSVVLLVGAIGMGSLLLHDGKPAAVAAQWPPPLVDEYTPSSRPT